MLTTPVMHVMRRSGEVTTFDSSRIAAAVTKAFQAVEGSVAATSRRVHEQVEEVTQSVMTALARRTGGERLLHLEEIQDQVELALMRAGHHKVARAYVLYREERARLRATTPEESTLRLPMSQSELAQRLEQVCQGLSGVDSQVILQETVRNLYDGMPLAEMEMATVLAARSLVETDPGYSQVAMRLLLQRVYGEAPENLAEYVRIGVEAGMLDPELARFDLARLNAALKPERDDNFQLLGLQTLYDRYLLHREGVRFERPQSFFMRIAMGLSLREIDREARALEFYEVLSQFDFMCSTPTLFNAGTTRPQLSSCFLTSVPDHLEGIFKSIQDNALLSKYAGGLGNDWTRVRGLGSAIRGTNGQSQGVVPFLKVANDTAVAVNQGGKRKGAACAYLETWHIDIEDFLDLRKNTGDDRRRTHDMNTAHWIPDLFMQRVGEDGVWTLFSPDETPDLHELAGQAFATAYRAYEEKAARGELKLFRTVRAVELWRRMLTLLFETGHPWLTFKDPCNLRSPQQHCGVVHSSNLCTEITLNTSDDEVAVCNLGSVNLARHLSEGRLDLERLRRTVSTAVRMLDNVIDINLYTIPETRRSNLRHRPVGLGLMGFQDALYQLRLPYASPGAVDFADESTEAVAFFALEASAELARERGSYPSFAGSLWSQGILPLDTLTLLEEGRGEAVELDRGSRLDWESLRTHIRGGMRNSNVLAIAPTATIANICGVTASIEPTFSNLYVKANMSGDFTVLNTHLVADLKGLGLWDEVMASDLKYFDGSVGLIDRIPEDLRQLYATAFEFDSTWLVEAGARRQKWLDQSQSLNLYLSQPSGKQLDTLYKLAWKRGLKTTYYLRTQGATHVEKSTLKGTDGKLNAVVVCTEEVCEVCQ